METTFHINKEAVNNRIIMAKLEIEKVQSKIDRIEHEIAYLESEKESISAFLEYKSLQDQRKEKCLGLFVCPNDYGVPLDVDESYIQGGEERLETVKANLKLFCKTKEEREELLAFLQKDVELLESMGKAIFRSKFVELGVLDI